MVFIMSVPLLILLFVGLLAGTILSMSRQQRPGREQAAKKHGLGTVSLPNFRRSDFFSAAERSFYEILRQLTPNHTIFAKVRLVDLISIPRTPERQAHVNRLDQRHIDFVVCDRGLVPIVAINLNDLSAAQSPRPARDKFVEEVLAAVALPVIHLGTRRGWKLDDIHQLIAPYLRIGTPFI